MNGYPMGLLGGGYGMGLLGNGASYEPPSKLEVLGAMLRDLAQTSQGQPGYNIPMMQAQMGRLKERKQYQEGLDQMLAPGSRARTALGPNADAIIPLLRNMDPDKAQSFIAEQFTKDPAKPGMQVFEGVNPQTGKMGQFRFDASGKQEWLGSAPAPKAPTSRTIRMGSHDVTQEFDPLTGSWKQVASGAAWKPETGGGDDKAPAGYTWGPGRQSLIPIPGGPADSTGKNSKATDTQRLTALFANRASAANNILGTTKDLKSGADVEGTKLFQKTFASDYFPGGNYLNSGDFQKYDQAKRDFVNAVLRKESGAVIGKDEFDNADKQYFPQPGDAQGVIEQKRANRELAVQGLRVAAGTAVGTEPAPQDKPRTGVPSPGSVVKGYRFKGGDPGDRNNWVKV